MSERTGISLLAHVTPTLSEFLPLFNRLGLALRVDGDETGLTQKTYYEALKDLPVSALEAGALALMRQPGRRFFPTTAEWRDAATHADTERRRSELPADVFGAFHCSMCHDTGWELGIGGDALQCPGDTRCGRPNGHTSHTFTRPCGCRATNPIYQRHCHFGAGR